MSTSCPVLEEKGQRGQNGKGEGNGVEEVEDRVRGVWFADEETEAHGTAVISWSPRNRNSDSLRALLHGSSNLLLVHLSQAGPCGEDVGGSEG